MLVQELQEQLNKIWNGWQIKELLGEGSYGKVYRIERDEFEHVYEAALKVIAIPKSQSEYNHLIDDGMSNAEAKEYLYSVVKKFIEEFSLMSKLKGYSNIVSYEDHAVVELDDSVGWNIFIRMELLTPLLDYYQNESASMRDIVQLGIDICSALEICQQYNIVHGDIKPENIMVSGIRSYKLGDFGTARILEDNTLGIIRRGTMSYIAPEIYKGEKHDSRADIYSLGLVLYRFLNNNRLPFQPPFPQPLTVSDKEEADMRRISGEKIIPPINAHGKLAEIIIKACDYDSQCRYKSPAEMRKDLTLLLENNPLDEIQAGLNDNNKVNLSVYGLTKTMTYYCDLSEDGDLKSDIASIGENVVNDTWEINKKTYKNRILLGIICVLAVVGSIFYIRSVSPIVYDSGKELVEDAKLNKQSRTGKEIITAEKKTEKINLSDYTSEKSFEDTRIKVPNVIGKPCEEALSTLSELGLKCDVTEEYSESEPYGNILRQSVKGGQKIDIGTKIELVKSLGKQSNNTMTTGPREHEEELPDNQDDELIIWDSLDE